MKSEISTDYNIVDSEMIHNITLIHHNIIDARITIHTCSFQNWNKIEFQILKWLEQNNCTFSLSLGPIDTIDNETFLGGVHIFLGRVSNVGADQPMALSHVNCSARSRLINLYRMKPFLGGVHMSCLTGLVM